MDDPFFGRWWDRFPQRSSQRSPYSSHPYAEASVTPTNPEYDYQGAPKRKPETFIVPIDGPPSHPLPNSSSRTKGKIPAKPNHKNVVSEAPKSSSGFKKVTPRMDETSAATKIQSAFRGFSARKGSPLKNLRVIRDVKAGSEAIQRRLTDHQVIESILQNDKERLNMTEGIMSLLLKLDAIQGVNSFVREARRAATRELVKLQEMVDAIIAGKSVEGRVSMGAQAAEDDNHGDGMAASEGENGEDKGSERGANKEEITDEETLERGSNKEKIRDEELLERVRDEEGIRDEEVQDGAKLVSANYSEVQEEVSVLSDKIESRNMQIESPYHTEDDSQGRAGNGGEELLEVVVSVEPVGLNENDHEDQQLEPHDEDDQKCTDGASSCEIQACKRLKALDCSQAEAETIQADEQQREFEGMEYEETGEVIEAVVGENSKDEEDVVKVKEENERLKKRVVDLFKKNVFQNELITKLSLRVGQLEEQILKKTGGKQKTKEKKAE